MPRKDNDALVVEIDKGQTGIAEKKVFSMRAKICSCMRKGYVK